MEFGAFRCESAVVTPFSLRGNKFNVMGVIRDRFVVVEGL
jgi:hypothetical protein